MKKIKIVSLILLVALLATVGSAAAGPKRNFFAKLTGEAAGNDSMAAGKAHFRLTGSGEEVRFRVVVHNLENVTMAHIHVSETPGGNGPPAVWLYPDGPPPQLIPGRFDGVLASGTFTQDDIVTEGMTLDGLLQAISEGRAYVNVHTNQFPGGEIRGSIH